MKRLVRQAKRFLLGKVCRVPHRSRVVDYDDEADEEEGWQNHGSTIKAGTSPPPRQEPVDALSDQQKIEAIVSERLLMGTLSISCNLRHMTWPDSSPVSLQKCTANFLFSKPDTTVHHRAWRLSEKAWGKTKPNHK
jgi:hypothetical protein